MTSIITKQAELYLEELVKALEVPPSRYEQAEKSYRSFGEWLHREHSGVLNYGPDVSVQGSFRLGTVIRPMSENEEYDIDIVCVLEGLSKHNLSQEKLKLILGEEIKFYRDAKGITNKVDERRRCWRLKYSDGAQFHMDIVPSIPNEHDQRRLLEERKLDAQFADTAIAITDNEVPEYPKITENWPRSNPRGYAQWFQSRMGEVYTKRREELLEEMKRNGVTASIEDIPTYRVRTPLQSAIMILKRHRDTVFSEDPENKPISIIISTLAAHAYGEEQQIGDALLSILSRMEDAIEHDGQRYIIRNPTDALENFADKWEEYPERAQSFYKWLHQARQDFSTAAKLAESRQISRVLAARIGAELTNRVAETTLQSTRALGSTLITNPTSASGSDALNVSFKDAPRTPKKPDGFA